MGHAEALVDIDKATKPQALAVFQRLHGGPADEFGEAAARAQVTCPRSVGDPASVYIDGTLIGQIDPIMARNTGHDEVVRLIAYLHSAGKKRITLAADLEGFPNAWVNVRLHWQTDDDGVPMLTGREATGKSGCMGGAALLALVFAVIAALAF
jgi:hypothetical protein